MTTKCLTGVRVKDEERGEVTAVFSTFNVVDRDGDVTLPGAFEDGAQVRISAYGHGSWGGLLPVGKGVVRTTDREAILEGQFFLGTTGGRDTFEVVKQLGQLQEWSYSVEPVKASFGEFEDRRVQFLEKLKGPTEVSPVIRGAGVNTRTLAVKGDGTDSGKTLHEELAAVLDGTRAASQSVTRVVALRAEKGKQLSKVNSELVGRVVDELESLTAQLRNHAGGDDAGVQEQIRQHFLRFVAGNLGE